MRRNDFFKSLLFGGGNPASRSELETETLPYTFNSNSYKLRNYRIYGNTVNEESVGDLVTEGEYAGKYHVPIMITNGTLTHIVSIYLPEQIKMVGNKAEYIDCKKQKQHTVSKNLFDYITHTQNTTAGYLLSDNQRTNSADWVITDYIPCDGETFTINPIGGNTTSICLYDENKNFICGKAYQTGGAHIKTSITITSTQNASYIRFSYNTGGTGTQRDNISNIMLNAGSEPLSYEPYIQNTELDVTLPTLPTTAGTNTLSVGTTVQPSKVYLQGKISEAEIVSAEPVQTNVQSLQPLSLNDDLQLDVMPIDRSEFQINDISEVPVEDENSVEEIPETENFETSGDEENAE